MSTATAPAKASASAPAHSSVDPIFSTPDFMAAHAALTTVKTQLGFRVLERDDVIDGLLTAVLAGQHVLLLGPPGTGKSYLMSELAKLVSDPATGGTARSFYKLLTKSTKIEEIIGALDIAALEQSVYRYITRGRGMMIDAHIALLDEIGRASSAILNVLLDIINERRFANGGVVEPVDLITLIGSSNTLPDDPILRAFMDRLPVRYEVQPLSDAGFARQWAAASQELHKMAHLHGLQAAHTPSPISLEQLFLLQAASTKVLVPAHINATISKIRTELRAEGITPSDRRFLHCRSLLQASALLRGSSSVEADDLGLLAHALWDAPDQRTAIAKVIGKNAAPVQSKVGEIRQRLSRLEVEFNEQIAKADKETDRAGARTTAGLATRIRAKEIMREIGAFRAELSSRGQMTAKIEADLGLLDETVKGLVTKIIDKITDDES